MSLPFVTNHPESQWTPNPLAEPISKAWNPKPENSTIALSSKLENSLINVAHQKHPSTNIVKENGWLFSIDDASSYRNSSPKDMISISLFLNRTLATSGSEMSGRIEINCKSGKRVKLGKICVELMGFEVELPTSDAVIAGTPDEHGMWLAKKGQTVLDFPIILPKQANAAIHGNENGAPLPSSFWNRRAGGIRYLISGTVHYKLKSEPLPPLRSIREIQVLEYSPATAIPNFPLDRPQLVATEIKKVISNGWPWVRKEIQDVKVDAEIHVPETGQDFGSVTGAWISGSIGLIGVNVFNSSNKKVRALKINLVRRLKTFSRSLKSSLALSKPQIGETDSLLPVSFSRTIVASKVFFADDAPKKSGQVILRAAEGWAEDDFFESTSVTSNGTASISNLEKDVNAVATKSGTAWWNGVNSNEKRKIMVDLHIPIWARSIRFGLLIDVSFVVQVILLVQNGPTIELEIPVTILHPLSLYKSLPQLESNKKYENKNSTKIDDNSFQSNVPPSVPPNGLQNEFDSEINNSAATIRTSTQFQSHFIPASIQTSAYSTLSTVAREDVMQNLEKSDKYCSSEVGEVSDFPLSRISISDLEFGENQSAVFQHRNVNIPISTPCEPPLRLPVERNSTVIRAAISGRDAGKENLKFFVQMVTKKKKKGKIRPTYAKSPQATLTKPYLQSSGSSRSNLNVLSPSPVSLNAITQPRNLPILPTNHEETIRKTSATTLSNLSSISISPIPVPVVNNFSGLSSSSLVATEFSPKTSFAKAKAEIERLQKKRDSIPQDITSKDEFDIPQLSSQASSTSRQSMLGFYNDSSSETDVVASVNDNLVESENENEEINLAREILESEKTSKELEETIDKMFEGINL
ncbi:hypothetical protein HK096_008955 [Nowakowskiella sp. JEL0078]|nr:hypothetical protein HK096_008955 [Nowakowskiella sp. JEL0078]